MKGVLIFLGTLLGAFFGSLAIYNHDKVGSLVQWAGVFLTALGIYLGISSKHVKFGGYPFIFLSDLTKQNQCGEIRARIANNSEFLVRIDGVHIVLKTRFLRRLISEHSISSENTQNVDLQPNSHITSQYGLKIPYKAEETKYKKVRASVVAYHSGLKRTVLKKDVVVAVNKITYGSSTQK